MSGVRDDAMGEWRKKRLFGGGALAALVVASASAWVLFQPDAKPGVIQAIRSGDQSLLSPQPQVQQTPSRALQGNDEDWIRTSEGQQAVQASREFEARARQRDQQSQERPASFDQHN